MEKENFDSPEWKKYFEDKSSEEIKEIKKTFGEKTETRRKEKEKESKRYTTNCLIVVILFISLISGCWIWIFSDNGDNSRHYKETNSAQEKERKEAKSQQLERKIPLLESGLTEAMKADTKHISDAKVKISMSKEGKYLVACDLYFKPDISKNVIAFYCKSVCEKSFTGYPDIDYNRTIIRGYKNGKIVKEYSPLTEKSEKVNDEARQKKRTQSVWSSPRPSRREIDRKADAFRRELGLE